jgi:hypothetical protein
VPQPRPEEEWARAPGVDPTTAGTNPPPFADAGVPSAGAGDGLDAGGSTPPGGLGQEEGRPEGDAGTDRHSKCHSPRRVALPRPNVPKLQNRQAVVAPRLVGSTPAPLRSRITCKYGISGPGRCPFCRYLGTAPCEARPRRRYWSGPRRRECLPAPRLEGLPLERCCRLPRPCAFSRAEPHTPVDRGNGQPSSAASSWASSPRTCSAVRVHCGIHQLASPSKRISAGTSRARMRVASRMMPAARPIARGLNS